MAKTSKTQTSPSAHHSPAAGGEALAIARLYSALIAVLHPGWAIGIELFLPGEINFLAERCFIGLLFLVGLILSYVVPTVQKNYYWWSIVGYWAFGLHWYWIVYRTGLDSFYVMGTLVVSTAFTLGFHKIRELVAYSSMMIVAAIVCSFATTALLSHKFMLVAGVATAQLVGIAFMAARARISQNLIAAERREHALRAQIHEQEMEAARVIQKNLLRPQVQHSQYLLHTYYQSASQTGGDWYGHFHDPEQNVLYIWIGDVTGHGLPSAMVTAVACGALYACEKRLQSADVFEQPEARLLSTARVLNDVIRENGGSLLMTMNFFSIDLASGDAVFINAGHRMPLVRGTNGEVHTLLGSGDILGFTEDPILRPVHCRLNSGDQVFFYTDGLIENTGPDGMAMSTRQVHNVIQTQDFADVLPEVIKRAQDCWQDAEIADDVTVVNLKVA